MGYWGSNPVTFISSAVRIARKEGDRINKPRAQCGFIKAGNPTSKIILALLELKLTLAKRTVE